MNVRSLLLAILASVTPFNPLLAEAAGPASKVEAHGSIVGPAIYVSDMQRSLHFYRDLMGMTVRMSFGPPDRPDVVIGFGDDPTKPCLMLLSDRVGSAPRPITHGHGYSRFAVNITDLTALQKGLSEAGYATSEIREVHGSHRMMMATDPDGYQVEILEPLQ